MRLTPLLGLLIVSVLLPGLCAAQGVTPERAVVAVVRDGPSPSDSIVLQIAEEVRLLTEGSIEVEFKRSPEFMADWDGANAERALQAAFDDPEVDVIVARGNLVFDAASRMTLDKPVVIATRQLTDIYGIGDLEGDRSAKPNLSFTMIPHSVESDVSQFKDLRPVTELAVLTTDAWIEGVQAVRLRLQSLADSIGVRLVPVPVGTDPEAAVAAIPGSADGVILGTTSRLTTVERMDLISAITQRGLPTFSIIGREDVKLGALAARLPDIRQRLVRRAALNIATVLRGESANDQPVILPVRTRLVLNGEAAAAIGWSPPVSARMYAEYVNIEALMGEADQLDLARTFQLADEGNLALAIASERVEIVKQDRNLSLSPLLPQVVTDPNLVIQDPAGLDGLIADRAVNLRFGVSQMIYDDRRVQNYRSSKRLYEGSQANLQAARMDAYNESGIAFLRYALSIVLYEIEADNLRLTDQNLELAIVRESAGFSGRNEVLRWEAEVAKRQADLLEALATSESERIALNQILALDQSRQWAPNVPNVDPGSFPFLGGRLEELFLDEDMLTRTVEFFVDYALVTAPELTSVSRSLEAREIQLGQRKRQWWLPSFLLDFVYNYQVWREPQLTGVSQDLPRLELRAQYPIFTGASRSFEVSRAGADVRQLTETQQLTRNLVERRVRSTLVRLQASFPSIALSRDQARAADENLQLVQDQYAQGLVNVTDLLDATNESFTANQGQAAALYQFWIDLVQFQRSIAWFEDTRPAAEVDLLWQQLEAALAAPAAAP